MATLLFLSGAANAQFGLLDAVKDSKKEKEAKKQQELALAKEEERKRVEEETRVKIRELKEKGDADKKLHNYEAALASYEECARLNETIRSQEFKTYEFDRAVDGMKRQIDHLSKMNAAYNAKDWNEFLKLATDSQFGFGSQAYNSNKFTWREDTPADIKSRIAIAEEEAKWTCSAYDPTPSYTNAFHEKNAGKILFSKQEIKSEEINPVLTDNFTLKDNIYAHFYLQNNFRNECYSIGLCETAIPAWYSHMRFTVDGSSHDVDPKDYNQESVESEFGVTLVTDAQTTQLARNLSSEILSKSDEYQWLWEFFYYLPNGTHKIRIEKIFDIPAGGQGNKPKYQEKFGKERVLVTGEFTITVNAADKLAFSNKMCIPFDKVGKSDAAIEARFKKEAGAGASKVWISSSDWSYERNAYGVVVSRRIYGQAISKDTKTGKYALLNIGLHQEAVGNGFSDGTCSVKFQNHIPSEWVK